MILCRNCGYENQEHNRTCSKCSQLLFQETEIRYPEVKIRNSSKNSYNHPKKSASEIAEIIGFIIKSALAILAVIMVIYIIYLFNKTYFRIKTEENYTADQTFKIEGTIPEEGTATIYVNGERKEVEVNEEGKFFVVVELKKMGQNKFTISYKSENAEIVIDKLPRHKMLEKRIQQSLVNSKFIEKAEERGLRVSLTKSGKITINFWLTPLIGDNLSFVGDSKYFVGWALQGITILLYEGYRDITKIATVVIGCDAEDQYGRTSKKRFMDATIPRKFYRVLVDNPDMKPEQYYNLLRDSGYLNQYVLFRR